MRPASQGVSQTSRLHHTPFPKAAGLRPRLLYRFRIHSERGHHHDQRISKKRKDNFVKESVRKFTDKSKQPERLLPRRAMRKAKPPLGSREEALTVSSKQGYGEAL